MYRYPLDMIASGIEASQWGYNSYGFAPFVASALGNFVAGLGNYWLDRVTKMRDFERGCESPHLRITYEQLCQDPTGTLDGLLDFLGLDPSRGLVEAALQTSHGRGPGDYKVDYADSISSDSLGRGSRLPRSLLPTQIERINRLLTELDYPCLEHAWDGDLRQLLALGLTEPDAAVKGTRRLAEDVERVLSHGLASLRALGTKPPRIDLALRTAGSAEVVLRINAESGVTRADPAARPDQESLRIVCFDDILLHVAANRTNLAQALFDGDVRCGESSQVNAKPTATRPELQSLVAILHAGRPALAATVGS